MSFRSSIRLIYFIPNLVFGHDTPNIVEDPFHNLLGDIVYTPCQAKYLRENGMEIPDSSIEKSIDDDEDYCPTVPRGALDVIELKWKNNFNESTNRYEVPYMFDGTHNEAEKNIMIVLESFLQVFLQIFHLQVYLLSNI